MNEALDQAAELIARADALVIAAGAGMGVPSVRHFSQQVTALHGGRTLRLNPREPTLAASPGVGLALGAREALQALDERLD